MVQNIHAGNAHLVNTYTHHSVEKIAVDGLDITNGALIKIDGSYVDLAGPGDCIEGVSVTRKVFSGTNTTVEKQKVNYRQVKEYDTLRILVVPGTLAVQTQIGELVDIDANQYVDLATVGAGTQLRIEGIFQGGREVEVAIMDSAKALPGTARPDISQIPTENPTPPDDGQFSFYNPATGQYERVKKCDLIPVEVKEDLTIGADGQTSFTLANPVKDPHLSEFLVNHIQAIYGVHYTIAGTTLTRLPANAGYDLKVGYHLKVEYFVDC